MLTQDTSQHLLQRYPMLRDLPASQQEDLMHNAVVLRAPAGTMVFDENQVCQGFPLVLSGSVRVIKVAANGRELQLYRVEPGDSCILTTSCLLGKAEYHARGIVDRDAELIVLPPATFRQLVAASESFRDYVFDLFSERLTDLMQLVSAVAFQKLDQRLAALLASRPTPVRATHQALADELGSVREMVSRLLKSFEEQGWIKLGREQIEIIDARALKKFSSL
jgi:CRP/FNR family transcriptional regulator